MTRLFRTTAFCTIFAASPALADITVDDAWAVWKAQFQALGVTFDASETREGNALQIGEIRLSVTFPQNFGSGYLTFTGPRFTPTGDGTVQVRFPATSLLSMGGTITGEGSFAAAAEMVGSDAPEFMSGDPGNVTSIWNSTGFEIKLLDVAIDGEEAMDVTGSMTFGPMTVSNTTLIDATHVTVNAQSDISSYDLSYSATFKQGQESIRIDIGGAAKAATSTSELVLPRSGIDPLGLHAQLRNGLRMRTDSNMAESSSYQRIFLGETMLSDQSTAAASYVVDMSLDKTGLDLGGSNGAFAMNMQMPEVPFPLSMAAQSLEARLLVPLLKSDTTQKAAMSMVLKGLTVDEQLWGLLDPATQLPRDPITFAFDLATESSLLFEFLDIRALMAGAEPVGLPVKADRVTLNSLTLSAAGAELTGTGDFILDFDDMSTFDGIPAPDGQAAFLLKGANGLIDKLIAMGVMSTDDALGARLMMNMVTVPGEGDDVLTSQIEVRKTGEISANGQRLR